MKIRTLFTDDFWNDDDRAGAYPLALLAIWLYVFAGMLNGWVWLLDSCTLAIHEFGHPAFSILSQRLTVYGGTLTQLIFPLAFIVSFAKRRSFAGFVFSCCWLAASLRNVGVYCADARAMLLPLVGGLDPEDAHDWHEILGRWHALAFDHAIGGLFKASGYGLMAFALCLIVWSWRHPAGEQGRMR